MFNMESMHLLNLSVQNALEHIAENFNLKNFLGGACARNSLEMCAVRSPDGRYRARILPVYTTSLLFTLFCQSGTYPFLDIGIVRCDWLRSKPKQSKFDQELLEMSQTHMLISKNVNNDVTMNYCWFSVSRHSK